MLPHPFAPTNSVKQYLDPVANRVKYRVLSPTGATIAEAIDVEKLACQIACIDELVDSFDYLVDYARNDFWHYRYDLKWSEATLAEIAADLDGAYEGQQYGMPEQAGILLQLNDLQDYVMKPSR